MKTFSGRGSIFLKGMSGYCNLLSVCLLSFCSLKFSLCCPLGGPGSQVMESIGCSGDTRVCTHDMVKSPEGACAPSLILAPSSPSLHFCRFCLINSQPTNSDSPWNAVEVDFWSLDLPLSHRISICSLSPTQKLASLLISEFKSE